MEQLRILPNLHCDACKAALVRESKVIRHYFQLIKRGIYINYDCHVCKICYEQKQRFYTLKAGFSIYREYRRGE